MTSKPAEYPVCNAYFLHGFISETPVLRPCRIVDFEEPTVWIVPSGHTNGEAVGTQRQTIYMPNQLKIKDLKRRKLVELKEGAQCATPEELADLLGASGFLAAAI